VELVAATGGRAKADEAEEGGLVVRGSDRLAVLLTPDSAGGSTRMGLAELKNACYYERPFSVTFDGEAAGTGNGEYVGVRHPLVRAAVAEIRTAKRPLPRYAVIALHGLQVPAPAVVLLSLVETTGLRPQLELHPVAHYLDGHGSCDEIGYAVLQALTAGGIRSTPAEVPATAVIEALRVAEGRAEQQRYQWERERSAANAALVDARIASQSAAIDVKVQQAERTLQLVSGRDPRLTRMYESRVRNLTVRRQGIQGDLGSKRLLAVTRRPIGVAVVVPAS